MTKWILFSLLRTAISADATLDCTAANLTEESLADVYTLSKHHDMAHLCGYGLKKIGYGESLQPFHKKTMQAVYRCARQQDEFEKIAQLFEDEKIPYVPLKGTVIRDWYPEPWMRTSTDIDILIRKEDLDTCIRMLSNKLDYKHHGTAFHDASLFSPSGVHLELHYELADATVPENLRQKLADVWNHVSAEDGSAYRLSMDDDWFYFYHIFHMTKHLINGGCGIKPFLDLWIMKRTKGYCAERYAVLLESCGLLTAAKAAENLAEIWFSEAEMDELSLRLESFVLDGGVHGTLEGNVAVSQARSGSRFRNLWQKIVLPYDIIKELYPILNRHKWMLPGVQVLRWLKLLFGGRIGRTANIVWKNITTSEDTQENAGKLLRDLDLLS